MEWKETKNPLGNNAMIFYNSAAGEITCDPAYRMFELGEGINEFFNGDVGYGPGIYFSVNSGINEACGLWIENGKWYPIIQTKDDGEWMIMYWWDWDDLDNLRENPELKHGYEICEKLMEIVRERLSGEADNRFQHDYIRRWRVLSMLRNIKNHLSDSRSNLKDIIDDYIKIAETIDEDKWHREQWLKEKQ